MKEVKAFAKKMMGTEDNRVDVKLNSSCGAVESEPLPRVRVRLARKRNEDEDAENQLFTLITHVPVETFDNLGTTIVKEEEEQ